MTHPCTTPDYVARLNARLNPPRFPSAAPEDGSEAACGCKSDAKGRLLGPLLQRLQNGEHRAPPRIAVEEQQDFHLNNAVATVQVLEQQMLALLSLEKAPRRIATKELVL